LNRKRVRPLTAVSGECLAVFARLAAPRRLYNGLRSLDFSFLLGCRVVWDGFAVLFAATEESSAGAAWRGRDDLRLSALKEAALNR
jgi:hypothetical protein